MGNSIQFESRYALNLEIIAGCTPMPDYPDFWRADISIKRLQQAAARYASFIFVFVKEKTTYAFGISACELLLACEQAGASINTRGTRRYALHIHYSTGTVYKSPSLKAPVAQLHSNKHFGSSTQPIE